MSRIEALEPRVHGRGRGKAVAAGRDQANHDNERHFGVHEELLYAHRRRAVEGAQWTGIVTSVALEMLRSGRVEGVVCVQGQDDAPRAPKPMLALTEEDILASRGVKPSISPNLSVLAEVEARGIKKLLFIGVGCSVQTLRSVEKYLGLEKLYVLGTNCTDNGPPGALDKFLNAASDDPATVKHYEFMQDYNVHLKHTDGRTEKVPYFSLPADQLRDVIAPSCYSCFDYPNNLADMVVGYMGTPWYNKPMTEHPQYVTIRNARGREMFDLVAKDMYILPTVETGDRKAFVMQTLGADDDALFGEGPEKPMPIGVGRVLAWFLEKVGPRGLEFGRYSLDYHTLRNYLYVRRNFRPAHAEAHIPDTAKRIVAEYNKGGAVDALLAKPGRGPRER